jgi:hypothetical protein
MVNNKIVIVGTLLLGSIAILIWKIRYSLVQTSQGDSTFPRQSSGLPTNNLIPTTTSVSGVIHNSYFYDSMFNEVERSKLFPDRLHDPAKKKPTSIKKSSSKSFPKIHLFVLRSKDLRTFPHILEIEKNLQSFCRHNNYTYHAMMAEKVIKRYHDHPIYQYLHKKLRRKLVDIVKTMKSIIIYGKFSCFDGDFSLVDFILPCCFLLI